MKRILMSVLMIVAGILGGAVLAPLLIVVIVVHTFAIVLHLLGHFLRTRATEPALDAFVALGKRLGNREMIERAEKRWNR